MPLFMEVLEASEHSSWQQQAPGQVHSEGEAAPPVPSSLFRTNLRSCNKGALSDAEELSLLEAL